MQFVTGIANVVLHWPLLLAVLHNGGAAVLLTLVVAINYRLATVGGEAHGLALPRARGHAGG